MNIIKQNSKYIENLREIIYLYRNVYILSFHGSTVRWALFWLMTRLVILLKKIVHIYKISWVDIVEFKLFP